MAVRIKTSKDLKRLTEERNAAMEEYSLVMRERDTVHKEIEKLQDDLAQSNKKLKTFEVSNCNEALTIYSISSQRQKDPLTRHFLNLFSESFRLFFGSSV